MVNCNWCQKDKKLVQGKRYCHSCNKRCFRECCRCKRPLDRPTFFTLSPIRCNSCHKRYEKEKMIRMNSVLKKPTSSSGGNNPSGASYHDLSSFDDSDSSTTSHHVPAPPPPTPAKPVKRAMSICPSSSDDTDHFSDPGTPQQPPPKKKKRSSGNASSSAANPGDKESKSKRGRPKKCSATDRKMQDFMQDFLDFLKEVKRQKKKAIGLVAIPL